MCGLHGYKKRKYKSTGETYFHGGRNLPEDSNLNLLVSLSRNTNFIDAWINTSEKNISWCFLVYQDKMKEIFQNNYTEVKTKILMTSR